ncbi:uncharacterized protein [Misgurnus anguillicaudatus]|uniref:uncharacterized protein n=1 Tax=Misgurnus anguillicaudatus TaxID=75329 RepID=UPI003CCFAE3F
MDKGFKYFDEESLDLDCLLSVKVRLHKQGLLDSQLKTNLQFSIQAIEHFPASKRYNACLTVEGDDFLVKIIAGNPVFYYTVHTGPNGPQLHQKVKPESKLTTTSLSASHFAGHQCRDEIESCMEQARKVLSQMTEEKSSNLDKMEIKITCGELHLTYSTHQPQQTIYIQPRRRISFGKTMSVEKILETKTYLEKSGEMGKSLLTCFQHVLQITDNYWENNHRIMLQGDTQILEFVIGKLNKHATQDFFYTDAQTNVQKKQIIDRMIY